jgi:putative ABC transport system permease protein
MRSSLSFAFRMAYRELRGAWGRLVFFFLCVAVGVAAIVVLRSVMQEVRSALTSEARDLVGGDLVLRSPRPWTDEMRAQVQQVVGPGGAPSLDVVDTQTMAGRVEGEEVTVARLVEVRAVEEGFPFYGTLELADGTPYSHALLAGRGALVQPELLAQFDAAIGDRLRIGGLSFTVRGVVARDRMQRSGGFELGPRVYIDLADLRETPLLGFGSRASHQLLLQVAEADLEGLTEALRDQFRSERIRVRSWRGVEDRIGRNLTLAENYLSLVGFAIVVLGGIGVWSVTRVFVQQKIKSVAILKCLGASSPLVLATYMLQVGGLAAAGSLAGVVLAGAALTAIPVELMAPLVTVSSPQVTWSAAGQGVAVGLLVSLLFAVVPLLEMRRVKPLLLLRNDAGSTARRRDWQTALTAAAVVAALVLVAIWQADSLEAGFYVSAGLAVVGLALLGAGHVLMKMTRPLVRSRRFALRHAVISLGRPGNQTRVVLMAVGLGCFFILSVRALQENLLAEFDGQLSRNAPDLVLIDIQPNQLAGVRATVAPYALEPPNTWPMMRARVVGIQGRRVNLPDAEAVREQGRLTREYGITYRDALQDNERLVAGQFWPGRLEAAGLADGVDTEVSIEQDVQEDVGVEVGDIMRFDVGGRMLTARITSIREVIWDETQNGGFFFVFRPAPAVERVAQTFVGFVKVPPGPEAAGRLQRDLLQAYPNVSVIDVREVLASIKEVVDSATLGVAVVGGVTLFSGLLILVGAVAVTKFQRLYEAAVYRTLGASTRLLASMTAIEYGVLGGLAGVLGAAGALALSWAVATQLFEIDWQPAPGLLGAGIVLTAAAVCLVGVAASVDVLFRKPLGTLRRE